MSVADDALYAPLSLTGAVDFLYRCRSGRQYDWKPISQRAIDLTNIYYADAYKGSHLTEEWMLNFTSHPPDEYRPGRSGGSFYRDNGFIKGIVDQNFAFEEVPHNP